MAKGPKALKAPRIKMVLKFIRDPGRTRISATR